MDRQKTVLTTGEVAKICSVAPRTVSKWFDAGPSWLFGAGYGAAIAIVVSLMTFEVVPFIYFQF